MLKISAQLNDRDFQGTAEELATFVSEKLAELGFGERHRSSERLVRFYAYQKLLSRPEKAPDDGRQRLFGQLQVRQLLLARLLAERGWDLDRIRTLLLQNQEISALNKLIDELATPTEAEKLFFRTRASNDEEAVAQLRTERTRLHSRMPPVYSQRDDEMAEPPAPAYKPVRKSSFSMVQQMKQIADTEESPAEALRLMIKKELARDDLNQAARSLLDQLLAFNPSSRGDEPKTERWTKVRLTHWCEAHFNIDSRVTPTKEELLEIADNFSKALMKKYL
jgi:DNA-binding transcriptional MerR regulator